jgi:hypothetical protein
MAEIDIAEIDRDLLAIGYLRPRLLQSRNHAIPTIQVDGI